MPDPAAPFELGDGPDACLLLHGLTGSPAEVRPIGEALANAGVHAVGRLLPGHGSKPEDLARLTRHDLIDDARGALAKLRGARRIYVCGLSAGALVAMHLAAGSWPAVEAIALVSPAIKFSGLTWLFTQLVGRLPPLPLRLLVDKGERDMRRPPAEPDGAYRHIPVGWGRELRLLSEEALALAPQVRARALLLHGALDETAAPESARLLAARLGSNEIALRIFERSGHVLPLDVDGPAASAAVAGFFCGHEAAHGAARPGVRP